MTPPSPPYHVPLPCSFACHFSRQTSITQRFYFPNPDFNRLPLLPCLLPRSRTPTPPEIRHSIVIVLQHRAASQCHVNPAILVPVKLVRRQRQRQRQRLRQHAQNLEPTTHSFSIIPSANSISTTFASFPLTHHHCRYHPPSVIEATVFPTAFQRFAYYQSTLDLSEAGCPKRQPPRKRNHRLLWFQHRGRARRSRG